MEIKVAIIGATGYSGFELIKLVLNHPIVKLVKIMASEASQDKPVDEVYPQLRSVLSGNCESYSPEKLDPSEIDLVFAATPDKISAEIIPDILAKGIKVIDLSGAFRLKEATLYPKWYGFEHKTPKLLSQAVYGLAELNAKAISKADLIANPGCYPTGILLALAPLLESGLIDPKQSIICDAKSGVTGAGKVLTAANLFTEVNENFRAYNVLAHRHAPEIKQELRLGQHPELVFVTHLLPINRGILATIYLRFQGDISHEQIREIYDRTYSRSPFIRLYENGKLPETKFVAETNYCDLGWMVGEDRKRLVLVSAIDNLVKGAAGQALQNLNLRYGIGETAGLSRASRTHALNPMCS